MLSRNVVIGIPDSTEILVGRDRLVVADVRDEREEVGGDPDRLQVLLDDARHVLGRRRGLEQELPVRHRHVIIRRLADSAFTR